MNLRKDHLHDVYPNFKPESYCESLFTELTRGQLEAAAFYTWLRPGAMCQPQLQTFSNFFFFVDFLILSQLLAMDASARISMKDAAKCDKRREWQNSENQENAERILHF